MESGTGIVRSVQKTLAERQRQGFRQDSVQRQTVLEKIRTESRCLNEFTSTDEVLMFLSHDNVRLVASVS